MSPRPPKQHAFDDLRVDRTLCGRPVARVELCGSVASCTCERCLAVLARRPRRIPPPTPEPEPEPPVARPRAQLAWRPPRWMRACDDCAGTGWIKARGHACTACQGNGRRWHNERRKTTAEDYERVVRALHERELRGISLVAGEIAGCPAQREEETMGDEAEKAEEVKSEPAAAPAGESPKVEALVEKVEELVEAVEKAEEQEVKADEPPTAAPENPAAA